MDPDPDEEEMEDVRLDSERDHIWRMGFEDNYGGVDNEKALLHANGWDVYTNNNKALVKGGYSVEVSGSDGNKVLWEVINDNVVEEGK